MSEWTAQRLRELPENTLIRVGDLYAHRRSSCWVINGHIVFEDDILAMGDIHVVAVPVEALLSEEANNAASLPLMKWVRAPIALSRKVLMTAIEHVTGE